MLSGPSHYGVEALLQAIDLGHDFFDRSFVAVVQGPRQQMASQFGDVLEARLISQSTQGGVLRFGKSNVHHLRSLCPCRHMIFLPRGILLASVLYSSPHPLENPIEAVSEHYLLA